MRGAGRACALALACACFSVTPRAAAAEQKPGNTCRVMVVGFVGGIGTAHFPPSTTAPLNHRLQRLDLPGYCFKIFSGYCPWCGHRWVKKQFGKKGKTGYTPEQIADGPTVITYGYSLGGPSVLYFARMLQRDGIPVELAVTVDSKGFTKGVVPANVRTAANFYEQRLFPFLFGKRNIRPEDPWATHFLGNIRVLHTGHLTIPRTQPVRDLLVTTVQAVYARDSTAVGVAGEDLPPDASHLPLRHPQFHLGAF